MSTPLESTESLTRAAIEVKPPPIKPTNPAAEAALRIQEEAKLNSYHSIMEGVEARGNLDKPGSDKLLEQNFGEMDPLTGEKQPLSYSEQQTLNTALDAHDMLHDFLDRGYNNLDNNQKMVVVNAVIAQIKAFPGGEQILTLADAGETQRLVENIIRENPYLKNVRATYDQALKLGENPDTSIPKLALQAKNASETLAIKKEARQTLAKELNDVNKIVAEFNDLTNPNSKGSRLRELTPMQPSLTAQKAELDKKIQGIDVSINRSQEIMEKLRLDPDYRGRQSRNGIDPDTEITRLQTEIDKLKGEKTTIEPTLIDVNKKIDAFTQLQYEEKTAKTRGGEVHNQLDIAISEQAEAALKVSQTNLELQTARSNKEQKQATLAKGLQNAFGDAAKNFLADRGKAAEQAQTKLLEDERNKAKTGADQRATDNLNRGVEERYFKQVKRGREIGRELNKDQIKLDYQTLVTKGPQGLMENVQRNMSPEMKAKLDSDPAFRQEYQNRLLEKVIGHRLAIGGLSKGDVAYISQTEWGKQLIQRGLDHNEEASRAILEAQEKGVIQGPVAEWFQKRGLLGLLLTILLGAGGALAGPALSAMGVPSGNSGARRP